MHPKVGVRRCSRVQGYLSHMKTPTPLGTPWDPSHKAHDMNLGGCIFL